jgi:hypothetical protein
MLHVINTPEKRLKILLPSKWPKVFFKQNANGINFTFWKIWLLMNSNSVFMPKVLQRDKTFNEYFVYSKIFQTFLFSQLCWEVSFRDRFGHFYVFLILKQFVCVSVIKYLHLSGFCQYLHCFTLKLPEIFFCIIFVFGSQLFWLLGLPALRRVTQPQGFLQM